MSDFVGPQQASPFDSLDEKQRAHLDKALAIANGVQLYKAAGGAGVATQWKPYAEQIHQQGGLDPKVALLLAQYKMWKGGAPVIPQTKQAPLTPDQISANRDKFINNPEMRSKLIDEGNAAIYNSQLGHFDSLVMPKKEEPSSVPASQPTSAVMTDKKEVPA